MYYKIGDKVKIKGGLVAFVEFGYHHYPNVKDYVPYEILTISKVIVGRKEYKVEEKPTITLNNNLIEGLVEKEKGEGVPANIITAEDIRKARDYIMKDVSNNTTVPNSGWCPDPSKETIAFIAKTFGKERPTQVPGKMGIAWNLRNTWKIEGYSNYTRISDADMHRLIKNEVDMLTVKMPEAEKLFAVNPKTLHIPYNQYTPCWVNTTEQSKGRVDRSEKINLQEPVILKQKVKSKKLIIT